MPLRVLHASETTLGGLGRVLSELACDQLARGHTVAVAAPPGGPVPEELTRAGVTFHAWPAGPRPGRALPREVRSLREAITEHRPDVLHLHAAKAGLAGRLVVRRRIPTVFQPHAWSFFAVRGAARTAALQWERIGARWADVVLCVSADEREAGKRHRIHARYRVLPNGLDLERWEEPAPGEREAVKGKLGLGTVPLAVCVGRLHRQKGQEALLDAWPAVRDVVPGALLALVGDGPDRPVIERREVPGVRLVGETGDVRTWLAAATVVVQPSRWEGMSLALLEALASGRSVVVTDVPGMREVVGDDAGAIVGPEDRRALVAALVERLRDPGRADAEGRAGRRRITQHHDLRRQLDGVAELYDELLAERRRS